MKTLTKGMPLKVILFFSIPLFIGQLFQLFYSVVDTRIVGETLGEASLAAVGATTTLSDFMMSFMNGLTNGFAIIVSTFYGAKDENNIRKTVAATFIMGLGIAFVFSVVCLFFLNPVLTCLNVSGELISEARQYVFIIIAGLCVATMYNICAAVLRAVGDTLTPLIILIISSFLNITLDYSFILGLHMGVAGAAYATVLSQAISASLCFIYMWYRYKILRFGIRDMRVSGDHIIKMIKTGLSMGLMYSLVNFGTVALQTTINTFGTGIIVAHTAARKLTSVFMLPFSVFGQALATYCGQNLGAKEYARIRKGLFQTIYLVLIWDLIIAAVANLAAGPLIRAVTATDNMEIIQTATTYLRFNTTFYFITTFVCLIRNALQGIGDSTTPVISSSLELLGKVVIALIFAPIVGYWGIIVSEPIVWTIMVIPLLIQLFKNPYLKKVKI